MFHRKNLRLKNFDYSGLGPYFITICTHNRQKLFGTIADTKFHYYVPELEKIFKETYIKIENEYDGIKFHISSTMPDHVHFIVSNNNGINISRIVAYFKVLISKQYDQLVKQGILKKYNEKMWLKNYNDRIIRNEKEYEKIYNYIFFNPQADWYKEYLKELEKKLLKDHPRRNKNSF